MKQDCSSNWHKELELSPNFWSTHAPREALKPSFGSEDGHLCIMGNNNPYIFGYWRMVIDLEEQYSAYKIRVKFKVSEIEDINLHVMNLVCWFKEDCADKSCPHDIISSFYCEGEYIIGENDFKVPPGTKKAEIQLGLRYSKTGKVKWKEVSVFPASLPESRIIKVTTMKWRPYDKDSRKESLLDIAKILNKAGNLESDIVLLPEFTNLYNRNMPFEELAEEIPDGETCKIIREKAIEFKMNICVTMLEKCNDIIFNTAIIFDRKGCVIGKYRKVHLYWPEEMFYGESPGEDFPVFQLDIGKVGIMICYDSWFVEVARLLALKGAEIILFPNEGYEELIIPARAIDNRVYIAVSSLEMPSMIVDPKGKLLAKTVDGLISTPVDLNIRVCPHPNSGGTLNTAPGGRRGVRNSTSTKLYGEILQEVKSWEENNENFSGF